MMDFSFRNIAPRLGGQRESFEELCCQLARLTTPSEASFVRLDGTGGDGGVECFVESPDGSRTGWQAKYVFKVDSLLTQANKSLDTALGIHPTLRTYVVCFPFDLTGPTGRRGKCGHEKFEEWRTRREAIAKEDGRELEIRRWAAADLRSQLLDVDHNGGIREFFFNERVLSRDWFEQHLRDVVASAGPRYTPELSVETDLWSWIEALGRTPAWEQRLQQMAERCKTTLNECANALSRTGETTGTPAWPVASREAGIECVSGAQAVVQRCSELTHSEGRENASARVEELEQTISGFADLETTLAHDLEDEYGSGRASSAGFRQFMAEYCCTFPAANLDDVRDAKAALMDFHDWLRSPSGWLAFEPALLLTGVAGSGKTHGVCDAVKRRLPQGRLSCVAFGHEFRGEPDPWTRLQECLGIPADSGRDAMLDLLNAAAEASTQLLIICIDAINETRPLRYWRDRTKSFVEAVRRRPNLRLCLTCRSSFLSHCLPADHGLYEVEHRGFTGIEREACLSFFQHHELEPPLAPMLQPEFANPLYLILVCKTLQAKGLRSLPEGWIGLAPVIRAFLEHSEQKFAVEHETTIGAAVVSGTLMALAREIADTELSAVTWSRAQQLVSERRPTAAQVPILEWMIRESLLVEDAPQPGAKLDCESSVRLAFERLGDFLIARELLERIAPPDLGSSCEAGGQLAFIFDTAEVVDQNAGLISALSILLPEDASRAAELPNLVRDASVRSAVIKITVTSYPWRDPSTFTEDSRALLREALHLPNFAATVFDTALAVCFRPSVIDANWLQSVLTDLPLASRDSFWCNYLHERYENDGPVRRLIQAAFDLPLDQLDEAMSERWLIALAWFTAAADRRVKDLATRALTCVLAAHSRLSQTLARGIQRIDDDAICERVLLSIYGALILSRDRVALLETCDCLFPDSATPPVDCDNALIRDHSRCIVELARHLGVLRDSGKPELKSLEQDATWPLELPSDNDIERWETLPKLVHSCLRDDFFRYSLGCLHEWEHGMPRPDMGKWILAHVADHFGYADSRCKYYDEYMLAEYGAGRAREMWAERIGKKYQWIALYRLASLLSDHVERKRNTWAPDRLMQPLLLVDERQLDPTLPSDIGISDGEDRAWWIFDTADLRAHASLSDEAWVAEQDDLPVFDNLIRTIDASQQRWRLLEAYLDWGHRERGAPLDLPYRHVWIQIRAYLVAREESEAAFACLRRRNFFGKWMPEGASWCYRFAGEYPWATPFNTEPEEYFSTGGYVDKMPFAYIPACNQLAVEWEYDASLPRNFQINLPARAFFDPGDLWWNGRDGFGTEKQPSVFRDPSVTEPGPSSLIVDAEDLQTRLGKLGLGLLWTLLGEKLVVGGRTNTSSPRCTFSQVARLQNDGSLEMGERAFFTNYDENTGPFLNE